MTTNNMTGIHVVLVWRVIALIFISIVLCVWYMLPLWFSYPPVIVSPVGVDASVTIDEPMRKQAFYGTLNSFPHGYRFTLEAPQQVSVQIFEPWSDTSGGLVSGIIVEEVTRGVKEVARLESKTAAWEYMFNKQTGDAYKTGAHFTRELQPGTYFMEVSSADNNGRYMLHVGTHDVAVRRGYIATLKDVYVVKDFLGKSPVSLLLSFYYYVPLLLSMFFIVGYLFYRRHLHA